MAEEPTVIGAEVYFNDYMRVALNALGTIEEWLPSSPVDVDEQVYVNLGGEEFERYGNDTRTLERFIADLRKRAKKAKGAEVLIKFNASGYDDDYNAEYELGYWREPTKKERAEREETNRKIAERAALRAEEAAERERAEFERLKAKFA